MRNDFKFKIFDMYLKKSFFVSKIDFLNNEVYYITDEKMLKTNFDDAIILFPTGISDCHNRPIYEGDIITYQLTSFSPKTTSQVTYENGCFLCKQLLSQEKEARVKKESINPNSLADLLCLAQTAAFKPLKIIGNIFTYKNERIRKSGLQKLVEEKVPL